MKRVKVITGTRIWISEGTLSGSVPIQGSSPAAGVLGVRWVVYCQCIFRYLTLLTQWAFFRLSRCSKAAIYTIYLVAQDIQILFGKNIPFSKIPFKWEAAVVSGSETFWYRDNDGMERV